MFTFCRYHNIFFVLFLLAAIFLQWTDLGEWKISCHGDECFGRRNTEGRYWMFKSDLSWKSACFSKRACERGRTVSSHCESNKLWFSLSLYLWVERRERCVTYEYIFIESLMSEMAYVVPKHASTSTRNRCLLSFSLSLSLSLFLHELRQLAWNSITEGEMCHVWLYIYWESHERNGLRCAKTRDITSTRNRCLLSLSLSLSSWVEAVSMK